MGTGGSGSTGGMGPGPSVDDCAAQPAPRAPLRRLTRFEYNNTARDLLGDTTAPANAFPSEVLGTVAVVASNDLGMLEERLAQPDVAALILEPSGGSWATVPLIEGYLQAARELASRFGVVLIFDEVITGFRWAPGGAQERYGVGSLPISDLRAFVTHQVGTVGHIDGEGHCDVGASAH